MDPQFLFGVTSTLSVLFIVLLAYILLNANKADKSGKPKGRG